MDYKNIVESMIKLSKDIIFDSTATAEREATSIKPAADLYQNLIMPFCLLVLIGGILESILNEIPFKIALVGTVIALIAPAISGVLLSQLASAFGGEKNHPAGIHLATITMIPYFLGKALAFLPTIGWVISLAGSVYSLILIYQLTPHFLNVPDKARVVHFVAFFFSALAVYVIIGVFLMPSMHTPLPPTPGFTIDH